jgi:hypothetical protein
MNVRNESGAQHGDFGLVHVLPELNSTQKALGLKSLYSTHHWRAQFSPCQAQNSIVAENVFRLMLLKLSGNLSA